MEKKTKSSVFVEELRNCIDTQQYSFATAIPSERSLAEQYKLSRATIRHAIQVLIDEGYLKKSQGKGTFVMKHPNENLRIQFKGMTELLRNSGFTPSNSIIATETCKPSYKMAKIFNIGENEELFRIIRLRSGNDQPISIEDTYVLSKLIPEIGTIDFQIFSLYDLLAFNFVQIDTISHMISTAKVRNSEAKLLDLNDGDSVISIRLTSYNTQHKVVEYTRVLAVSSFCGFYTDCFIKNNEVKVYAQSD